MVSGWAWASLRCCASAILSLALAPWLRLAVLCAWGSSDLSDSESKVVLLKLWTVPKSYRKWCIELESQTGRHCDWLSSCHGIPALTQDLQARLKTNFETINFGQSKAVVFTKKRLAAAPAARGSSLSQIMMPVLRVRVVCNSCHTRALQVRSCLLETVCL